MQWLDWKTFIVPFITVVYSKISHFSINFFFQFIYDLAVLIVIFFFFFVIDITRDKTQILNCILIWFSYFYIYCRIQTEKNLNWFNYRSLNKSITWSSLFTSLSQILIVCFSWKEKKQQNLCVCACVGVNVCEWNTTYISWKCPSDIERNIGVAVFFSLSTQQTNKQQSENHHKSQVLLLVCGIAIVK